MDYSKIPYDPSLNLPPPEVMQAAKLVATYMGRNGSENWCLGPVASRTWAERMAAILQKQGVDVTKQ